MLRAALEERFALVLSIVACLQPSAAGGACTVAVGDCGHNAFAALVVEDTFYVSDGFQKVFRVPRGNGSGSELAATVVSGAMGLALDSQGRLLVSDQASGGVSVGLPGAARTSAVAGLSQPIGVLLDAQENLLVVEGGTGSVLRFDKAGQAWNSSGVPVATGLSNFPLGITMGADQSLYIADTQNSRIVKWAPPYLSGTVLMDNIQGATGIAVDDAGIVYFTQSNTHRVLALHPGSTKTTLVAGEGGVGTGLDQLNFPSGLTISDGSLYIADRYNNRIVQCPLIASTTSTTSSSSTSFTTTTVTSTTETSTTPTTSTPTTSTSSSSSSITATTVTSTTKMSSSSRTSTSTSSSSRTVTTTTVTSTTGTSSSTTAVTTVTSTTVTSSSTLAASASSSSSRVVDALQTTATVTTTTGTNSRTFTSTSTIITNRGVAHSTFQSTTDTTDITDTTDTTSTSTVTTTNKAGTSSAVNNNRETTATAPSKRKASGPLMTSTSMRSTPVSTTFFQITSDAATTLMTTTTVPSWSTSAIHTGEPGPERASKKHVLVLLGMTLATESVPPGYKGAPDTLMNVVSGFFLDFIAISLGLPLPPSAVTTEQAQPGSAAARTFSDGFEVMELEVKINAHDSVAAYNLITVFSADHDILVEAIQRKIEALPGFGAVQIRNLEVLLEQGNPRLLALEEPVAKSVLPRLTNSSLFVIDSLRGGGTTVAANLRAWYQGNTARQLSVRLPGPFERQVSFPAQLFHDLGQNGEELVLVVIDENKVTPKPKPWLVTGIVSISLYVSGQRATVRDLADPIEFNLNVPYEPGMVCVYWDETRRRWSMQGMHLSSKNTVGSPVRCAVTHLTIFGVMLQGFLDAFFCSQFQLFSMAALASLTEMQWLGASGASFCLCLCFLLCVAAVVACIADRRSICRYWSMDDLFLIAVHPTGDVVPTLSDRVMATENSDLASRTPSAQYRCCNDTLKGFRALWARCDSSAFKEFIDEVFSHWFDNFGDLRMMIEDVFSDVRTMMARGYTVRIAYRMMTALLTRSAKRAAAASLRLSLESVSFVLADKELAVLLANRFERLLRADSDMTTPQVPWHCCMTREAAWAVLHAHVTDSVHSHMVKPCCRLRQCVEIFVMNSPLGILLTRDLFMSRLMRIWLHVMDLVGTLFITSLFYAASGTLKGKKKTRTDSTCVGHGLDREVAFIIGRHLAIAAGSVFLSALPVSLCASFITRSIHQLEPLCADWQRHLRVWRLERRMVWILSSSYIILSVLFIVLFLANLGDGDHRNWVRTSFLGIVISDAIVPLAVAIVGPSVAHASMTVNSFVFGGSIADMRQVAVKHLLQTTNIKLPGRIMV